MWYTLYSSCHTYIFKKMCLCLYPQHFDATNDSPALVKNLFLWTSLKFTGPLVGFSCFAWYPIDVSVLPAAFLALRQTFSLTRISYEDFVFSFFMCLLETGFQSLVGIRPLWQMQAVGTGASAKILKAYNTCMYQYLQITF